MGVTPTRGGGTGTGQEGDSRSQGGGSTESPVVPVARLRLYGGVRSESTGRTPSGVDSQRTSTSPDSSRPPTDDRETTGVTVNRTRGAGRVRYDVSTAPEVSRDGLYVHNAKPTATGTRREEARLGGPVARPRPRRRRPREPSDTRRPVGPP